MGVVWDGRMGGGLGGGEEPAPAPTPELPTAPQNVAVASGPPDSGEVSVTWAASPAGENVTLYRIYVNGNEAGTDTSASTQLTGLTSGETISVTVRAENAAGLGPASDAVTGTAG